MATMTDDATGRVRRRITAAVVLTVLVVAASATAVLAQDTALGGKLRAGEQVLVGADEVVEGDLYVSAGLVRIEGTVTGDLLATGGQVDVTGRIGEDVTVAAGQVDIAGVVDGDVHAAGGQLTVLGEIGEDLFAAGGQVTLSGDVGEDLVFGTGQMVLNGSVSGDVLGSAGSYVRNGTVAGSEDVTIVDAEPREPTVADRVLGAFQRFVSILVVAALVLWAAPRVLTAPARTLRRRPLASIGLGVLALAGVVVVVGLLLFATTLSAIVLGFLGLGDLVGALIFGVVVTLVVLAFLLFLAVVFGAPAVVGMWLGDLLIDTDSTAQRWASLGLGLVVVVAVTSLPIIGGWLALFVVLFGLGAILLAIGTRGGAARQLEPEPETDTTATV